MLFERWREIASKCAKETALVDLARGTALTFEQLSSAAETSSGRSGKIAFPYERGPEFIIQVLQAWKAGRVVCPLEPTQPEPALKKLLPSQVVHLKMTSATTGAGQMIAFTAGQMMADAENIVATMGLRPEWPNLGVISLAHSYGFSNLVLPLLLHGVPLALLESALPEALRRAGEEFPAVTLAGVPALWRAWDDAGAVPRSVRLAISAGAPLPLSLEAAIFNRSGIKVHNFYGSSECGGIAYDSSDVPRADAAYAGAPMRGVNVSVGKDGCLEVRGAAVGEGFWPESRPSLENGIFRTSDLGEVRDGGVYFHGRACDRINVAGRKVSPEAIERVLATHPEVRECLAFGVPAGDAGRGESIVACVAGQKEINLESVKQHVLAQLPAWQVPRDWWLVESLQPSQRGKLSRSDWRKRYLARNGNAKEGKAKDRNARAARA